MTTGWLRFNLDTTEIFFKNGQSQDYKVDFSSVF